MVEDIINDHKHNRNTISVLQSIQNKYGYIPEDKASKIARELNIPLSKLYGVATFYSQFKLKKPGKNIIQLCNGTACHINGSKELLNHMKNTLNISNGETTEDKAFTLDVVNCIGACARAPAMMVNGKVYGHLDTNKIDEIIKKYRKNE